MTYRVANPPDSEIVWCIQLYQSNPTQCLAYLRTVYSGSRIVLLMDGDVENLQRYQVLSRQFRTELIVGDHLMTSSTCHRYVDRLLQQALTGPERYFFRIDPDTRVWKRFTWLPTFDCAFGTLETVTQAFADRVPHPPNIQGGCIGLTRGCIEGVLASDNLTHDRCVLQATTGWARTQDCRHILSKESMFDDFLISWSVDAAGFPIIQHPEIASYWRVALQNTDLRFAVTHPHKEMEFFPTVIGQG